MKKGLETITKAELIDILSSQTGQTKKYIKEHLNFNNDIIDIIKNIEGEFKVSLCKGIILSKEFIGEKQRKMPYKMDDGSQGVEVRVIPEHMEIKTNRTEFLKVLD